MERNPVLLALREMQDMATSPRTLVLVAAATILLGLSGPVGTFAAMATPQRILYWLAVVVLSYGLGRLSARMALVALERWIDPLRLRLPVAALAASLPAWAVTVVLDRIALGDAGNVEPLRLWFYCFIIALTVTWAIAPMRSAPIAEAPAQASAPPPELAAPALLQRLPHPLRGRLLHLAVADHYVEVATDKGTFLVLMRLSDAIRETVPVKGLQVHRSHWVALDAVSRATRLSGKPVLELVTGATIPISRTFLDNAKAAGLVA